MNGWNPRFNLRGELATGYGEAWAKDRVVLSPAHKPRWISLAEIVALGAGDALYLVNVDTLGQWKLADEVPNHVWAAGAGQWRVKQGNEIALEYDAVTGALLRLIEHAGDNNDRSVYLGDDVPLAAHGPYGEIRAHDGLVVWTELTNYPDRRILGIDLRHQSPPIDLGVTPAGTWSGHPVPFRYQGRPWLLVQTNEDLRLYPWGGNWGYVLETGENRNFHPDVYADANGIRAAWNDARGVLSTWELAGGIPLRDVTFPLVGNQLPHPDPIPDPPQPTPEPEPMPENARTPSHLVDIAVRAGRTIDDRYPGLRERDGETWMAKVVAVASQDPDDGWRFGRKSNHGPSLAVSPDTVGIKPDGWAGEPGRRSPFFAVSIIRHNPPVNEWRNPPLDYGLLDPGQYWIPPNPHVETSPGGQTPGPSNPGPTNPPADARLETRVAALEALLGDVVRYGDRIGLRTESGHTLHAVDGGGGAVDTDRRWVKGHETWQVERPE